MDAQNNVLEAPEEPMVYLHGGYDGTFPRLEEALEGHVIGDSVQIQLEPEDAFGEYDAELLRIEERDRLPTPLEVGMQFEGVPERAEEDDDEDFEEASLIFTVTDIDGDRVVLDGNHPLAGMALRFDVQVADVRNATEDEIEQGYAEGATGVSVLGEDDEHDQDDTDYDAMLEQLQTGKMPPTLH